MCGDVCKSLRMDTQKVSFLEYSNTFFFHLNGSF